VKNGKAQECAPVKAKPETMTCSPGQPARYAGTSPRRRLLMVLGFLGLLGLTAGGLWWHLSPPPPPPPAKPAAGEKAKMESLSLSQMEDGGLRWKLNAQKAEYLTSRDEVRLQGLYLEFYGPGQETVYLWAQEGLMNTKSRDLVIKGEVKLARGDLTVHTPLIQYFHKKHTLVAPEEVVLTGPQAQVSGKDLHIDLANKRLILKQHQMTKVRVEKGLL
jgi:LPS export ABC transporter protein LptC